jgi:Uma2 family endonuclease
MEPTPMSTIERPKTPTLIAGQRLDRATFHERYEAMPPGTRAELIGGVVYMPSPLSYDHGDQDATVIYWLKRYRRATPGVKVSSNASVFLDDEGEPQPDVLLRILPEYGGQIRHEGKYLGGAPELVVEVASSSRPVDLGPKFGDYQRAGVLEYVVVALHPNEVFWFVRRGDRLEPWPPGPDGIFRSEVFPGLWLDPEALFLDDMDRLDATLEQGLATPEHAAFVAPLAERRGAGI